MSDPTSLVVLRRQFELVKPSGERVPFELRVQLPTPDESDPEGPFRCGYSFHGWKKRARFAYGIDSVQALLLALQTASAVLYSSAAYRDGRMTFLGGRDLQLPVHASLADLVHRGPSGGTTPGLD